MILTIKKRGKLRSSIDVFLNSSKEAFSRLLTELLNDFLGFVHSSNTLAFFKNNLKTIIFCVAFNL